MVITDQRKQEIRIILLKAKEYFKKDDMSPELEITFDSTEKEITAAKRYIGKKLHPDALARRTDLTEYQKKELTKLLSDTNAALDDIMRYRREKPLDVNEQKRKNMLHTINTFITRFSLLPQNQIINYYELFAISRNLPSDQILASMQYKDLSESLSMTNIDLVPLDKRVLFEKLVRTFNEFDKNVLRSKEGRYYYDRLLDNSSKKEQPKKEQPKKDKTNPYKEEINYMLQIYNQMLQNNFVDYYQLFKVDSKQTRYQILNSQTINRLNYLLKPERFNDYGLHQALQKLFNSLCKTYEGFIKWTLSSDEKKQEYDNSLAKHYGQQKGTGSKGTTNKKQRKERIETEYRYIFAETKVNPKEVLSLKVKNLYKALEQGIDDWGVSVTVLMLNRFFQIKSMNAFEPEMIEQMQPYTTDKDIKELYDELLSKYPSNNTLELAEKVMHAMLSRKGLILSEALTHTASRHSISQAVTAVHKYLTENDAGYISGGNETTIGREKVMMEISPEFIKYVLATRDSSKLLLLDFPAHMDNEYNDLESLNEIVREFIKTKRKGFTQ
jgi:hypothetical protein